MADNLWDHFEGMRLVVQGAGDQSAAEFCKVLMGMAKDFHFVYLAEFGQYLQAHDLEVSVEGLGLNYHLVGMHSGADVFGIVAEIIKFLSLSAGLNVERVEPDLLFHLNKPSSKIGSGFKLSGEHSTYRNQIGAPSPSRANGSNVKIAVIDSGVEPNVLSTPFHDFVVSGTTTHQDGYGHGTAMISIIQDVAPGASLHAVRVTDGGEVRLWNLMAGIGAAVLAIQADIVNLSLGLTSVDNNCPHCGGIGTNRSVVLEHFLHTASREYSGSVSSPVFVAAVGNDGPSAAFQWPARFDNVLAVGATNAKKELASFSNKGTTKNRYALCPGGEWNTADNTATEWVGEGNDSGTTTHCLGTSAATAYASGVLALSREHFINELRSKGFPSRLLGTDLLKEALDRCEKDISPSYSRQNHGAGRLVFDGSPYPNANASP